MSATGFQAIDLIAFVIFVGAWFLHDYVVHHSRWRVRTLSGHMMAYRRRWMTNMLYREPKMLDGIIQNSLQQGVLFFASTSILLVGALLSALGASEQALAILDDLPLAGSTTRLEWEAKILFMALIFVYAFFKFAWSYRLFNYVTILVGAAPDTSRPANVPDDSAMEQHAVQLGQLHTLAARHFTAGVNAYFHALAVISWFISPWLFIGASVWISLVLYRRAFRSRSLRLLQASPMSVE